MKMKWGISSATLIGSVLTALIALISLASPASAVHQMDDEPDLYEWFDGLGFHAFEKLPLVKVTTGQWSQSGDDPPKNQETYGFLIKGDKSSKKFTVFNLQFQEQSFEKTPPKTPAHEVVQFEPVDLADYCRKLLEARQAPEAGVRNAFRRFGEKVKEGTEFFVLARACAARGENKLAEQLIEVAGPLLKQRKNVNDPETTFQVDLSNDLAHTTMWSIILDFGDPKISRLRLLERLEEFKTNYPKSTHHQRAKETASLLKKMLFQEKKHTEFTDLESLPVKDRVAELIFRLRDQNGRQYSQPGSCDIFAADWSSYGLKDTTKPPPSPAHQLLEIGFDAVPQLIDAMEDKEFTRSVGYHRNFYFSHHVLRVGDCAERILSRIANRGFYRRSSTNGAMIKDSQQQTVKQQAEAWWKEVQTKGEKQVLIEATEAGDVNSHRQARQLAKKFPDAALAPIIKGVGAAENSYVKSNLIRVAAECGEPAIEFLTAEMKKLGPLQHRVDAANGVHPLKPAIAETAMIVEWKMLVRNPSEKVLDNRDVENLIKFLMRCNSEKAFAALRQGFDDCTTNLKLEIVSEIHSRDVAKDSPPINKVIEALLISAVADKSVRSGYGGSWGDYIFSDPRICEMANYVLSIRYPTKYKFNKKAIGDEADAQCREAINVWRSENGMDPLP